MFSLLPSLTRSRLDRCALKKGVGQSFWQKCRLRMSFHACQWAHLTPFCFCLHRPDLKRFKVKTSKIFEQLANIENIEDVASPSVPKSPLKFTVKLTDCKFDNCCCRRSDYPLKFLLRLKDFEGVVGAGVLKGEWRINVKRFNQIPPISSLCHWWPWWTKCYLCNSRPTSCDDKDDKQNPGNIIDIFKTKKIILKDYFAF